MIRQILLSGAAMLATTAFGGTNIVNYWKIPSNTMVYGAYKVGAGSPISSSGGSWSGTMWGKTVYMQGDETMSRFDAHEKVGSTLYYTGTFRGNMQQNPDISGFFMNPIVWLVDNQSPGSYNDTYYGYYNVNAKTREQSSTPIYRTARVQFVSVTSAGNYYHPELGRYIQSSYGDVYYLIYWPDLSNNGSREEYWLLEGHGQIRAYFPGESLTAWYDPDLTNTSYTIPNPVYNQSKPANPWYSMYPSPVSFQGGNWNTYVWNGAFENTTNHLTGWTLSSSDCLATNVGSNPPLNPWGYDEAGSWKCVLRGSSAGGDSLPDGITTLHTIPVTPGQVYTLSGWIYRDSGSDGAYLDFNDGNGYNSGGGAQSFSDQHAGSTTTGQWEYVSTDITIPSNVYGVKVRCVREGANFGNCYFDDIRLRLKL